MIRVGIVCVIPKQAIDPDMSKTTKIKMITPIQMNCNFRWPGLRVSRSPGKGFALFASGRLPAGTAIPIIGSPMSVARFTRVRHTAESAHVWTLNPGSDEAKYVDGSPSIHTYRNTGWYGMAIAMMANEPERKKPTCVFMRDCLITIRTLKAGEELTVLYGADYASIRALHGYSVARNPYSEGSARQLSVGFVARFPPNFARARRALVYPRIAYHCVDHTAVGRKARARRCTRCSGQTRASARCKRGASCRIGCRATCWQHAERWLKPTQRDKRSKGRRRQRCFDPVPR